MSSFIVDEDHLRRLSPAARRELLQLLWEDLGAIRSAYAFRDWNPEDNTAYPLDAEEAELLVRGMPETARRVLGVFARNYDGSVGTASLAELMDVTGHTKFSNINHQLSWILLRTRTVTGNQDAWLVNWRADDWVFDEEKQTYTEGFYFISSPAIESLRSALEEID